MTLNFYHSKMLVLIWDRNMPKIQWQKNLHIWLRLSYEPLRTLTSFWHKALLLATTNALPGTERKRWFCVRLTSFIVPYRRGRTQALTSACKTDQADFTYWMSFVPSNLMEEISSNTEALRVNIQSLWSTWKSWKANYLDINASIESIT